MQAKMCVQCERSVHRWKTHCAVCNKCVNSSPYALVQIISGSASNHPKLLVVRLRTPGRKHRGVTRGQGGRIPLLPNHHGAPNHCGGGKWLRWAPKRPNNVTSTFFNTVNLLRKGLRFEHGGAKLASCSGRHLTM